MKYPTTVSIVGNTFMAVAFLIMGPVPFINLEPSVPLIQVNLNLFKLILYNNNKKSFEMAKHSLNFLISNYLIGQYSHSWVWICSGDGFNLWKNTSCGNTKRFQR